MISWQVLCGSRASQAPLEGMEREAGGLVHHGAAAAAAAVAAAAAAAAPDGSRSVCLSAEKMSLQQLNRRLASYLQQVKHLEAANQRLECQIQEVLDRKCPGELRQLDGHLRTVSLLQDQISECLSAQAQVKLQLLDAELTIFDLDGRCVKECERRTRLEAEISELRLLGEVLKGHNLPELQSLLNEQMQEMADLKIQHQQDAQVLLDQVTGGVAIEIHTAESSGLRKQLDHLRQTSVIVLDKTEVSVPSSMEVLSESDTDRFQLEALRREVDHLTAELTQLQAAVMVLEASGQEQNESFVQQLEVLQKMTDGLCRDLDSALQAAAQQTADHQALLDIKSGLEAEIQDYRMLLDELSHQGVSNVHFTYKPAATASCLATSPSALRRNIMVDRTVSVQGGNLHMMDSQTFSRSPVHAVGQTPVVAAQSVLVHDKQNNLPITSANPLTDSFQKSENQRTGALCNKVSKFMISTEIINRQSSPVEDEVLVKDCDPQSSLMAGAQISQKITVGAFVKASETEVITTLVPGSTAAIQSNQETCTSQQAGSQANDRGIDTGVEINKNIPGTEAEENKEPDFLTHKTTSNLCKLTIVDIQKDRHNLIFTQTDHTEGTLYAKNKNPTQIMTSEGESPSEAVREVGKIASTILGVSGSPQVYRSTTIQSEVCGEVALMEDTDKEGHGKMGEEIVEAESVFSLDQSSGLPKSEPHELPEDTNRSYNMENASGNPESNQNLESKTISSENLKEEEDTVHDLKEKKMNPSQSDNQQVNLASQEILLIVRDSEIPTSLTDGASLSSSYPEEHLSPREAKLISPTEPVACLESTHDLEMNLRQNDQDPVEIKVDDKNTDRKEKEDVAEDSLSVLSLGEGLGLSDVSDVKPNKLMKDADSQAGIAMASPDSKENLMSKAQSTEILKTKVDEMEIVCNVNEVKMDLSESNKELVDLAGEKASKMSVRLTDSGVVLSSSSPEERLSLREAELISPKKPVACLNPTEVKTEKREVDKMELVNDANEVKLDLTESSKEFVEPAGEGTPKISISQTDSVVALSCSSNEKFPNPKEVHGSTSETKPDPFLSPEACLSPVEAEVFLSLTGQVFCPVDVADHITRPDLLLSPNDPENNLSPNDSDSCLSPFEAKSCLSPDGEETEEVCLSLTEANAHDSPVEKSILLTKEEDQLVSFKGDSSLSEEDRNMKVMISERDRGVCFRPSEGNEGRGVNLSGTKISSIPTSQGSGLQVSTGHEGLAFGDGRSVTADEEEQTGFEGLFWKGVRDAKSSNNKDAGGIADEDKKESMSMGSDVRGQRTRDWHVLNHTGNTEKEFDRSVSFEGVPSNRGTTFSTSGGRIAGIKSNSQATTAGVEGRFRHGSGEWLVYSGSSGCTSNNLPNSGNKEHLPEKGRFGSGEWIVYGGGLQRKSNRACSESSLTGESKERLPTAMDLATSPPETGRFGRSGEWIVYGGSLGHKSNRAWSDSSLNREMKEYLPTVMQLATSRPRAPRQGRFGSEGSGEWRVYGGSADRLSSACSADRVSVSGSQIVSPPSSHTGRAGSGSKLSSGSVVWRSNSVGSGSRLSSSGSISKLSSTPGSYRISSSGRFTSTGSGEWRPVYSSASGRKSSAGNAGWSGGGRTGVSSGSSSGRLTGSKAGGNRISTTGSGSTLSSSGSNDRISSQGGGRLSGSSGSGRTNITGGRVICSSDHPIRSTGSGAGANKERISVCKMAALSISAAGKEKSDERQRQAERARQQQATAASPLVQRWLSTGVGVTSVDPEGTDDIARL